jgi:hypothetical protein
MELNFEELVNSEHCGVRSLVAQNPNCPVHLLEKLADDTAWWVRIGVALNPNCPQYLKDYNKAKKFIECYGIEF